MTRVKALQIYMKPGIPDDDLMLSIWREARMRDRPQDLFRRMLRLGLRAMVENGEVPKVLMDTLQIERHIDSVRRTREHIADHVPLPYPYHHPYQAQPYPYAVHPGQAARAPQSWEPPHQMAEDRPSPAPAAEPDAARAGMDPEVRQTPAAKPAEASKPAASARAEGGKASGTAQGGGLKAKVAGIM